jgi:hypothetical protein
VINAAIFGEFRRSRRENAITCNDAFLAARSASDLRILAAHRQRFSDPRGASPAIPPLFTLARRAAIGRGRRALVTRVRQH